MSESNLIELVSGDSGPDLTIALTDKRSGAVIDLTGFVSGVLHFRAVNTTALLETAPLTLISAEGGTLKLTPTNTLFDRPAGYYEGEVQLVIGAQTITGFDVLNFYLRDGF